MNANSPRRGYAMVLVLVFIALILSLYGVSYRYVAAALRIETARTLQQQRDEGSVRALAKGLALLETGLPPSDPYICAVTLYTSAGLRSFTVTFTSEAEEIWSVSAAPTLPSEDPQRMPDSFAEPDPPGGTTPDPPAVKPPKKRKPGRGRLP